MEQKRSLTFRPVVFSTSAVVWTGPRTSCLFFFAGNKNHNTHIQQIQTKKNDHARLPLFQKNIKKKKKKPPMGVRAQSASFDKLPMPEFELAMHEGNSEGESLHTPQF